MTDSYPAIAEHGLIGDQQTCALVTTDGAIDWFCAPRFDSPSVFASLLDASRGGSFGIRPAHAHYVAKQLYFPDRLGFRDDAYGFLAWLRDRIEEHNHGAPHAPRTR